MAISNSTPLYGFISTGDKVALYTLRIMCRDLITIGGDSFYVNQAYYVRNLSNDKATAETKAAEACELMGLPFKGNADFELNEIRRERDAMATEKREAAERQQAERIAAEKAEFARVVSDGVMIMGKYTGQTPAEIAAIDPGYLFWLAGEIEATGKLGICAKIAADYIAATGLQKPGYVGTVGESLTIDLQMVRQFWTNGQYPTLMHICKDVNGCEVVFFSVAEKFKAIEPGESLTITGLVKDQREGWNNNKQTIINRPKLAK